MAYDFSADDVFEMAEQMERNGAAFYRDAAMSAPGDDARLLLLGLAEIEDEHEQSFGTLRSELSAAKK